MNGKSTILSIGKLFDIPTTDEETRGGDGFIFSNSMKNCEVNKRYYYP